MSEHTDRAARRLYVFTAILGLLIGGDILLGLLGRRSVPAGLSLGTRGRGSGGRVHRLRALRSLLHGRIGADFALAQACGGRPGFGTAVRGRRGRLHRAGRRGARSVDVFPCRRAMGRLVDQTPADRTGAPGRRRESRYRRTRSTSATVIVRPGERMPVDGPVTAGRSTVDQSALTGESLPIDKGPGDPVYTGTLNQFGVIEVDAEKVGDETTFGQVIRLVAQAQRARRKLEKAADRLARYFLPVVEVVALLDLADRLCPGWPDVWSRTVAVLVVACPCALVLATPAAMLASMAWLARHGVLIKGGGRRAPGLVRHLRLRQDGDADQGSARARQPGRDRRDRPRTRSSPGGVRRSRRASTRWPRVAVGEARRRVA